MSNLPVNVKVGLLDTIAKSIYSDTYMKIREAVANSLDANAKNFIFTLSENKESGIFSLSLFDDGSGMTAKIIQEVFSSIGYGQHKNDKNKEKYYSYFGLGMISVFRLGKKVIIITKTDSEINKIIINSELLFDNKLEDKNLDTLDNIFNIETVTHKERNSLSILKDANIKDLIREIPAHYTDIIIEDVNSDDVKTINSSYFEVEIRKILPLNADPADQFCDIFKKNEYKEFLPSINFFISKNLDSGHIELYKYFPEFLDILNNNNNYKLYIGKRSSFAYYFITGYHDLNKNANINNDGSKNRETGFYFRNKNFLVKGQSFLEQYVIKDEGNLIKRQPLKNWIFGEIFHSNMNEFLDVSRKDFIINKLFLDFRKELKRILDPIIESMVNDYNSSKKVFDQIVKPFRNIKESGIKNPIYKLERNIAKIEGISVEEIRGDKLNQIMEKLHQISDEALDNSKEICDEIKSKMEILNSSEDNYKVIIDPNATDEFVQYDKKAKKNLIIIPLSIFNRQKIKFLGKMLNLRFVLSDIEKGISFNENTLTINIAYKEFKNHSISFLELEIAIKYVYESLNPLCKDDEHIKCIEYFKNGIWHFLGGDNGDNGDNYEILKNFTEHLYDLSEEL